MAASYPVTVHTYTAHRDSVDYILADHVNSLQDEVTAIELEIGADAHHWTYTGDPNFQNLGDLSTHFYWTSVKQRLDSLQAHVVRLERNASNAVAAALPSSTSPQVVAVRNPGQSITTSTVQWTTYDMTVADFDPSNIFTGGSSLACPRTGWWDISASIWTDVADGPSSSSHMVANRIVIGTEEVAAHNSSRRLGSGGQHRINLKYGGPWNSGELLIVQCQQNPTPLAANVWSRMRISAAYVRATV